MGEGKKEKEWEGRGGSSSSSSFSQQKKIPPPPSHQSCSSAGHEFYIRRNCVGLSRLRQTLFFSAALLRAHAGRKIPFSLITGRKRLRQSQGRKEGREKITNQELERDTYFKLGRITVPCRTSKQFDKASVKVGLFGKGHSQFLSKSDLASGNLACHENRMTERKRQTKLLLRFRMLFNY